MGKKSSPNTAKAFRSIDATYVVNHIIGCSEYKSKLLVKFNALIVGCNERPFELEIPNSVIFQRNMHTIIRLNVRRNHTNFEHLSCANWKRSNTNLNLFGVRNFFSNEKSNAVNISVESGLYKG